MSKPVMVAKQNVRGTGQLRLPKRFKKKKSVSLRREQCGVTSLMCRDVMTSEVSGDDRGVW